MEMEWRNTNFNIQPLFSRILKISQQFKFVSWRKPKRNYSFIFNLRRQWKLIQEYIKNIKYRDDSAYVLNGSVLHSLYFHHELTLHDRNTIWTTKILLICFLRRLNLLMISDEGFVEPLHNFKNYIPEYKLFVFEECLRMFKIRYKKCNSLK